MGTGILVTHMLGLLVTLNNEMSIFFFLKMGESLEEETVGNVIMFQQQMLLLNSGKVFQSQLQAFSSWEVLEIANKLLVPSRNLS